MKKTILLTLTALSCAMTPVSAVPYGEMYGENNEPVQLTLAQSIEMALATDERIEAAQAGRDAAKWSLSATRRSTGPSVTWNSQAYRIGGENYRLSGYRSTFANSWNLTVPLYTGGQLENQQEAKGYALNRADMTLENTRQTVRFQAAEAYANLVHRVNLERIAQKAVDMGGAQLKLINDQYTEGAVAKADVLLMQVRLANYQQNLNSAQAALEVAESTLASKLGLPQNTDIEAVDVFSYEPYEKDLPACEAYALAHRPDGKAAELAVKSAEAEKDAAKSGYRPRVNGVAGKSITGTKAFQNERSDSWEAGITLSWNIFDNGVTAAKVQQAKADVNQYQAEANRIKKTIQLETRSAYIQMKTAEDNIKAAAAAVKQAEESYTIAQVRYEEGVDILLSVADAQEKLTQARSNYSTALYQYNLYRATLEKAMGIPVIRSDKERNQPESIQAKEEHT
ncbi:TolC family protein [Selenomonas ruminantium]|uniref:Outer membrane protein TolC n=1 Tax=Selenomonas ruminantium TaxID=971 RepID=A0A1K1PSA9_SELRU|nr:TolC family protein [Selenomonas ruminantium]SFW50610.1 Outer membrane protein TolC [Selenomonas ruminantium]